MRWGCSTNGTCSRDQSLSPTRIDANANPTRRVRCNLKTSKRPSSVTGESLLFVIHQSRP